MKIFLIILALAVLAIILGLGIELLLSLGGPKFKFTGPSPNPRSFPGPGTPKLYVVLGDSTAAGQGAGYEQGIAVGTARHLAATQAVTLVNLAVSGARMHNVLIDQIPQLPQHPDIVLVSAGSNDVTHLTPIGAVLNDQLGIIQAIKKSNPQAKILITGAAAVDAVPRFTWPLNLIIHWRVNQLNMALIQVAASQNVTWVPIATATRQAFNNEPSLFSPDHFHPSAAGYAKWTTVLNQALQN